MDPCAAYIHIPFCVRKCAYCDFLSFPSCVAKIPEYVEALCREIRLAPRYFDASPKALSSIYLGGGTPSLLSPEQVSSILAALGETFGISPDCEITLEGNPGTVDQEKLAGFLAAGVNRLSLGIQSLDDSVLQTLGRIHDSKTAKDMILAAQAAGFRNLSCDMMLGIPGQTLEHVKETLAFFLERKIPHVSLYSLILEEGTPMFEKYGGDIEPYVSQEEDRAMYHYVVDTLREKGYAHYEISNMAIPGYESRHNSMYWRAENYYAFGLGAHYYLGDERGTHKAGTIDEYIDALQEGKELSRDEIYEVEEKLTTEEQKKEYMMLSFRTGSGVREEEFLARFGCSVRSAFAEELEKETAAGLIVYENGAWHLTDKGFDLANQVFEDYI